jgi:hypothetical protein
MFIQMFFLDLFNQKTKRALLNLLLLLPIQTVCCSVLIILNYAGQLEKYMSNILHEGSIYNIILCKILIRFRIYSS